MGKNKNSVETVARRLTALFEDCEYDDYEEAVKKLSDHNICKILEISPSTLENYYNGNYKDEELGKGYRDQMKRLIMFRESVCSARLASCTKDANCMFQLKQKHWGGYQDIQRVENTGKQMLEIKINGANGKPLTYGKS